MRERDFDAIRAVEWRDGRLLLLDQRLLPQQENYLSLQTLEETVGAIRDMVVRGAPAIGIAAAYGAVLAAQELATQSVTDWPAAMTEPLNRLAEARPTAINLRWAVERARHIVAAQQQNPLGELLALAQRIHREDIEGNKRMGAFGAELIQGPCGVLTHCNTGALATGGYGTALGVIRSAYSSGKVKQVYADETRPWLQGARLTAWELVKDGIPVQLLADGAAAYLMKTGAVQWVIVGADRITANGDVANKIGTYGLAVAARFHGVKFMVAAPTSTFDLTLKDGSQIPIEERGPEEVLNLAGQRIAANGATAWNPVFDVTPAGLVDAIVTEKGVIEKPDPKKVAAVVAD